MKYLSEFRDGATARRCVDQISRSVTRPWTIMEVCGGQTHAILRHGIDQVLPDGLRLIHGPGCPVCVTPLVTIDKALELASRPDVILCSFGDMLRVPGSHSDLSRVKAGGGDVRVVYSPLDSVRIAERHPDREIVFLAIGFETTAPSTAAAVRLAHEKQLVNFSVLVSHVRVPPAIEAIAAAEDTRVDAFLAAGHVCCITGYEAYHRLSRDYGVPIVVTGFEPLDVLEGIRRAVNQLERGEAFVENAYRRVVIEAGNAAARALLEEVFVRADGSLRGIGTLPHSGFALRSGYQRFDAEQKFRLGTIATAESELCHAGEVLRGTIRPHQCPAFGKQCTPQSPLGAPMVSAEGACAAYYHHRGVLPTESAGTEAISSPPGHRPA